jgi:cyclase
MSRWKFAKGLHQVGAGSHAYLLPDGGWGWSNAGLVVDGDQSLLIDTLYDLRTTGEMLGVMADAEPAAKQIDILVNSHSDGDHTYGNELLKGARIVSSEATAEEFFKLSPQKLHSIITDPQSDGARFYAELMGNRFDFSNITLLPPTETYDREMRLKVGDKDVALFNVGPAHTRGDTLVQVMQDKVVYTGDLLFVGVHPAIWDGSLAGWVAACDRILAMDVDVVVPGHGPISDKAGVRMLRDYLVMVNDETRRRFDAGLSIEDAALDITFSGPFADWISPERIVGSVNFLYRQWGSDKAVTDTFEILAMLQRYVRIKSDPVAAESP